MNQQQQQEARSTAAPTPRGGTGISSERSNGDNKNHNSNMDSQNYQAPQAEETNSSEDDSLESEEDSDEEDDDYDNEDDYEEDEDDDDEYYNSDELETGPSFDVDCEENVNCDSEVAHDCDPNPDALKTGQRDDAHRKSWKSRKRAKDHANSRKLNGARSNAKLPAKQRTRSNNPQPPAQQHPNDGCGSTRYNTVNDSWYINYKGIIVILPIIFNAFPEKQLEQSYQRYSHGQRQKSLVIAHTIDLLLKLCLIGLPLFSITLFGHRWPQVPLPVPVGEPLARDPVYGDTNLASNDNFSETTTARFGNLSKYVELIIRDDVSLESSGISGDQFNNSSYRQAYLSHSEVVQLSETLIFGPLATSLRHYGALNVTRTDGTANEIRESSVNFICNWLDIVALPRRLFMDNWHNYRMATLFSLLNLLIIIVCICVPHQYLTNRLSLIALFTWLLMCLQNYLIYNNYSADLTASLADLPPKLAPMVSFRRSPRAFIIHVHS